MTGYGGITVHETGPGSLAPQIPALKIAPTTSQGYQLGAGLNPQPSPQGGLRINRVFASSVAEQAGLQSGDWLAAVNGIPINDPHDVKLAFDRAEGSVEIAFRRGGESRSVTVPLAPSVPAQASLAKAPVAGPAPEPRPGPEGPPPTGPVTLGATLWHRTEGGQRITRVAPGSLGELAGLRAGDVLTGIGDAVIAGYDHIAAALSKAGPTLTIRYRRDGHEFSQTMRTDAHGSYQPAGPPISLGPAITLGATYPSTGPAAPVRSGIPSAPPGNAGFGSITRTADGRRRSVAWLYYSLFAVLSLIGAIATGKPVGVVGTLLFGSYAVYLFRGGRFVLWIW